jgi:RimJ/RimL family protein N-acetyltransferase/2'-5' RNA ligase
MELVTHAITLRGKRITLRPMTEADWPVLLRWNSDPEVLYYAEGDDVESYSLAEVQAIYRTVSQNALCFIIEYQDQPIGECWLQRMNLERVLKEYPGFDVRRIDLMIGEKGLWGQGLGTEVVHLLTDLAFRQEGVDYIFGLDIADYNPRSRRAFEKNDYRLVARNPQPAGRKARYMLDLLAKNPRLGFHAYAIHLFFDSNTEIAIRSVWRELAESGTAPYFHHSANRPHLTLSIYRSLDLPEARLRLADLTARQAPLPISFQYYGTFPGSNPTIFLGPLVTSPLLEVQESVCQLLDDLGDLPEFDYYRPGRWIPHCGLASDFDGSRLYEALHIAEHLMLPLQGQICEIGLTEMRPVRHLCQWQLGSTR